METLLVAAIVMIVLAVLVQTGVLVGMYLTSRRLTAKAEAIMEDSKKLMGPVESIANNLKVVADNLTETGKIARDEALHIRKIVADAEANIHGQLFEVRERVVDTVDEARDALMRPVREYSAIASGIAVGIRTFFSRGRKAEQPSNTPEGEPRHPAA
jgi:hypothetical protein